MIRSEQTLHCPRIDDLPPGLRQALLHLLDALDLSRDTGCNRWEFALEINSLQQMGIRNSQLRWLVCKDLIEHALETTSSTSQERAFVPVRSLAFSLRSCFVLTDLGQQTALRLPVIDEMNAAGETSAATDDECSAKPLWDSDLRELRYETHIVKRYRVPSPNQQMVLASFEEEGWPTRVDDPLPPHPELDPKRRLHDTIKSLNRHQQNPLLRFYGDGTGEGVRWGCVG